MQTPISLLRRGVSSVRATVDGARTERLESALAPKTRRLRSPERVVPTFPRHRALLLAGIAVLLASPRGARGRRDAHRGRGLAHPFPGGRGARPASGLSATHLRRRRGGTLARPPAHGRRARADALPARRRRERPRPRDRRLPGVAAFAKAASGALLSSGGNAFSTRTASFIVQEPLPARHRLHGRRAALRRAVLQPALQRRQPGPRRSAWPPIPAASRSTRTAGVVGGIGVEGDGAYSLDRRPDLLDVPPEEQAARAGQRGFEPPRSSAATRSSPTASGSPTPTRTRRRRGRRARG